MSVSMKRAGWKERAYAIWIFFKYRYSTWSAYYTDWTVSTISVIIELLMWKMLALYIGNPQVIQQYGGDYASFLILGIVLNRFFHVLMVWPYQRLHEAWGGVMEIYLLSPIGVWSFMIATIFWIFASWSCITAVCMTVVVFGLGVRISPQADLGAFIIVLLLMMLALAGLSLIDASTFSLLEAKRYSNPFEWAVITLAGFVSGVYFPVEVMPTWLRDVAAFIPHTYAFRSLRLTLLGQASISSPVVIQDCTVLALFAAILIPIGVALFNLGLRKAEKDGNLTRWV